VKRIARSKSVAQGERAWCPDRSRDERARAQATAHTPGEPIAAFAWAAATGQPTPPPISSFLSLPPSLPLLSSSSPLSSHPQPSQSSRSLLSR